MSLTPAEIQEQYQRLVTVASQWGVSAGTLAQYVDRAGSYAAMTQEETGVPRSLPPRGSFEGITLAYDVAGVIGTTKARTIVTRYARLTKWGELRDGSPSDPGDADTSTTGTRWGSTHSTGWTSSGGYDTSPSLT